jgi:hypothetical protein
MGGCLKLWLKTSGDGSGELFAEFNVNGYCGQGEAWFDLATLVEKGGEFARYPLPTDETICIAGGFWNEDATMLSQEHLYISAYSSNSRGGIVVKVRVAKPQDDWKRLGVRYSASVELKSSYEQMAQFSKELLALVQGDISEVVLNESNE